MKTYEENAKKFLHNTKTTLKIEFKTKNFYFDGDKEKRNIYNCTLSRGSRYYTFTFGDSLVNTQKNTFSYITYGVIKSNFNPKSFTAEDIRKAKREIKNSIPSEYEILSCLDTFDRDFNDFCSEFGYNEDSKTAEKIYNKVIEQSNGLKMLFSDEELEQLREIQ